eukprot:Hpha_TRINITY_DN21393_c0_g1::TRINITY_DN21393_c0_g1_i1::g.192597::m.192597
MRRTGCRCALKVYNPETIRSYEPWSYQVVSTEVSRPAANRERRARWFASNKHGARIPAYGYASKWMPTIAPSGQDVEVDPFARISRQGIYSNMLPHWRPWYGLQKLLGSKGAPASLVQVAADLHRVAGVSLGESGSAELCRRA